MIKALVALGRLLFGKLSLCALAGALVGAGAGGVLGLYLVGVPSPALSAGQILQLGALLGLLGWLVVLLIIGLWLRYGARRIALPSFVTAMFTAVLTVYFNLLVGQPVLATLVGLVVGILVGTVLCWLWCRFSDDRVWKVTSDVR